MSLSQAREALSRLLSLTGEDGSPVGPTARGDRSGEISSTPETSARADIEELLAELRGALGIEELPNGSVSFSKWLREGEEEYPLRYRLSDAQSSGRKGLFASEELLEREETLTGQIDVGTVLTLTRRFPDKEAGNGGPEPRDSEAKKGNLRAEVQTGEDLESGATVKTETTWTSEQLGPVELGALEGFFRPAIERLRRVT